MPTRVDCLRPRSTFFARPYMGRVSDSIGQTESLVKQEHYEANLTPDFLFFDIRLLKIRVTF